MYNRGTVGEDRSLAGWRGPAGRASDRGLQSSEHHPSSLWDLVLSSERRRANPTAARPGLPLVQALPTHGGGSGASPSRPRFRRQAHLGPTPGRLLPRPELPPAARSLSRPQSPLRASQDGRSLLSPNLGRSVAGVPRSLFSSCRLAARHRNGEHVNHADRRGPALAARLHSPRPAFGGAVERACAMPRKRSPARVSAGRTLRDHRAQVPERPWRGAGGRCFA